MALDGWNSQIKRTNQLFDSLTDEQLANEVAPNRNTGVYLLGHLAAVHDGMLALLGLGCMNWITISASNRKINTLFMNFFMMDFWYLKLLVYQNFTSHFFGDGQAHHG